MFNDGAISAMRPFLTRNIRLLEDYFAAQVTFVTEQARSLDTPAQLPYPCRYSHHRAQIDQLARGFPALK